MRGIGGQAAQTQSSIRQSFHRGRLAGRQQRDAFRHIIEHREHEFFATPAEDMKIQRVAFAGKPSLRIPGRAVIKSPGALDGFPVCPQPIAHLAKHQRVLLRDGPVAAWAHIQKEISLADGGAALDMMPQ